MFSSRCRSYSLLDATCGAGAGPVVFTPSMEARRPSARPLVAAVGAQCRTHLTGLPARTAPPRRSRRARARLAQGSSLARAGRALREPCGRKARALRAQGEPCGSLAGARLEPCGRRASLAGAGRALRAQGSRRARARLARALREPCESLAGALREPCGRKARAGRALRAQGSRRASLAGARLEPCASLARNINRVAVAHGSDVFLAALGRSTSSSRATTRKRMSKRHLNREQPQRF